MKAKKLTNLSEVLGNYVQVLVAPFAKVHHHDLIRRHPLRDLPAAATGQRNRAVGEARGASVSRYVALPVTRGGVHGQTCGE